MDSIKRCGTCKYWKKNKDANLAGKCEHIQWEDEALFPYLESASQLAFLEDYENYYAGLRTLPNFGCVEHESK